MLMLYQNNTQIFQQSDTKGETHMHHPRNIKPSEVSNQDPSNVKYKLQKQNTKTKISNSFEHRPTYCVPPKKRKIQNNQENVTKTKQDIRM